MLNRRPGLTTVFLAMGTTIVSGLPVFLISALFVQIAADTDAPLTALGALVATYWVSAAVISPLAGTLANAMGSRKLAILSVFFSAASLAGSALFVPEWYWLFPWAMLGGASNATSQPALNHLLGLSVSPKRLALAYGLKQSAVPIAVLGAGLAIPILALTLGWQSAFLFALVLACLILLVYYVLGPPRAKKARKRKRVPAVLSKEMRTRLIFIAIVSGLASGGTTTAVAFTVTNAVHRGIDPAVAGFILSTGSFLGAISRIIMGILADRGIGGSLRTIAFMLIVGAGGLFLMALPTDWTYILGFIIATGIGWGWAGLMHYVVSTMAGPATPAATGVVSGGNYLGNALTPLLFGIIYERFGDVPLWLGVGAMLAISGITALWVASRPKLQQPPGNKPSLEDGLDAAPAT